MDYRVLHVELKAVAYRELGDDEAAAALNAMTLTRVQRIPMAALASVAYALGLPAQLM